MDHQSIDDVLQLLASHHRRRTIDRLRRAGGQTTLVDLATGLSREESEAEDGRDTERGELTRELAHCHLPKLEAHGVLEFDSRSGAIRYRKPDYVEAVLDALPPEATTPGHPQVTSPSGRLDSQTDT
jgi:hypothetical protein